MEQTTAVRKAYDGPPIEQLPQSLQDRIRYLEEAARQTGISAYLTTMTPTHLSWKTLGFDGYSEVYEFRRYEDGNYLLAEAYFLAGKLYYLTITGELSEEKSQIIERALGIQVNNRAGQPNSLSLTVSRQGFPLKWVKKEGLFVCVGLKTNL